jgi:hypothetical protein
MTPAQLNGSAFQPPRTHDETLVIHQCVYVWCLYAPAAVRLA